MKLTHRATVNACFIGYIVQAIVNNFLPLLLVTLQSDYSLELREVTLLITINFSVQLFTDLLSPKLIDKIGPRAAMIASHLCAALGLLLLTVLPSVLPPFAGIVTAVAVYAVGGGLLEVLVSPIVEACPSDNKEQAMSLLHSFYCWGYMGVVLLSTAFFAAFGIENWKILTCLWALIPFANAFLFAKVPLFPLIEEGQAGLSLKELFSEKLFWLFMLMMMCAGASEQAVSQWSSAFAETGLGVSKTVGDLAGPMAFALMMGLARLIFGKYGERLNLDRFMRLSCAMCIFCYLVIVLVPIPAISLLFCAVCGFSVGILWPGTFSKAAAALRGGGTLMFALLALAGDLGCSAGPTLTGMVSSIFGGELRYGILFAAVFPVLLLIGALKTTKE